MEREALAQSEASSDEQFDSVPFWGQPRASGFIHPIVYLPIHRNLVHSVLKDLTWPLGVPYVGACHTEYFIEMRMEAKRRLGPPHGQAPSNWITPTHMDHTAQIKKAEKDTPEIAAESFCEPLTPEDIDSTNAIARRMVVKLLALCCPGSMPGYTLLQQVPTLERPYQNFEKSLANVPMEGGKDTGSDDESDGSDDSDDPDADEVLDDDKSNDDVKRVPTLKRWAMRQQTQPSLIPLTIFGRARN